MNTDKLIKAELKESLVSLGRSADMMEYSLEKCRAISIKTEYNMQELDAFENLTSRFARTSDIYTQKIMKGITLILREDARTFLDRANLFEKIGISGADELKLIRDLRNEISHEYRLDELSEIFEAVVEYSAKLLELIGKTKEFIDKKGWLKEE